MDEMDGMRELELERRLREDLQRVPAPLGFEARVVVAARAQDGRRRWMKVRLGWAMTAVLLSAGLGAAVEYEHVSYQRKAAEAHEQAGLALHIAAQKLDLVRHELNRTGD